MLTEQQNNQDRRNGDQKALHFGRILDACLNEIYTFDARTLLFTQVNKGARRNLGYSMEELRNMTPLDLKPEITREDFLHLIEPLQSGQLETVCFSTNHRRKDGTYYPVEVHLHRPQIDPSPEFVAVILDISERKQALDALHASEKRFSQIFSDAAAGLVTLAEDGRFLQVNRAITTFFGYSRKELLQMTVYDITFAEDMALTQDYYRKLRHGELRSIQVEKRYRHKNGQIIWGHTSITFVPETPFSPSYFIGLVQDITRQKRSEERLREINQELDAFVRTVSHDLRSPLTTILGFAQHLRSRFQEDAQGTEAECLTHIQNAGKQMLTLLEDLLTLSKLGHVECPPQPVNTGEIVNFVIQSLLTQGLGPFEVQVAPLTPVRIPQSFLMQIFDNLLGNAVRYGNPQSAPIKIGEQRVSDRIRFFVRDHGPGLPEEEREQVFETFYRGSGADNRPGSGIGLATVRKIAKLSGGRAWWEETPGGGSTFWVEFPYEENASTELRDKEEFALN